MDSSVHTAAVDSEIVCVAVAAEIIIELAELTIRFRNH